MKSVDLKVRDFISAERVIFRVKSSAVLIMMFPIMSSIKLHAAALALLGSGRHPARCRLPPLSQDCFRPHPLAISTYQLEQRSILITLTYASASTNLPDDVDLFSMSRDEFSPSPSSFELDVGSNPDSFPTVLHSIVSNESSDDCIHWLPCGTHFSISDKEK
eukprot:scaffold11980_cov114-Skeletonema_dohrnii-CCMP3373.AAC.1